MQTQVERLGIRGNFASGMYASFCTEKENYFSAGGGEFSQLKCVLLQKISDLKLWNTGTKLGL